MKVSKVTLLALVMLFAGSVSARTVLQAAQPQQPMPGQPQPQQPMPGQPQQPMPAAGQAMPPAGEGPVPPQCQAKFEPENVDCSFNCPATGDWRFRCETSKAMVASCNVRREEGNDQEAQYFLCLVTPNQPPNCQQGIAALNTIPDPCVTQNVNQIVGGWNAAPRQG
jgi:hypothetical protein